METASAPLSGSSSVQNLSGIVSGPNTHSASVCMGAVAASSLRSSLRIPGNLQTPTTPNQQQHLQPHPDARQTSFDSLEFGGSGCQSDGNSPSNMHHESAHRVAPSSASTGRMPFTSFSPLRPPQSPMDTDVNGMSPGGFSNARKIMFFRLSFEFKAVYRRPELMILSLL